MATAKDGFVEHLPALGAIADRSTRAIKLIQTSDALASGRLVEVSIGDTDLSVPVSAEQLDELRLRTLAFYDELRALVLSLPPGRDVPRDKPVEAEPLSVEPMA